MPCVARGKANNTYCGLRTTRDEAFFLLPCKAANGLGRVFRALGLTSAWSMPFPAALKHRGRHWVHRMLMGGNSNFMRTTYQVYED